MEEYKIVDDGKIKCKFYPVYEIHEDDINEYTKEFLSHLGVDIDSVTVNVSGNSSHPGGFHDQPCAQTIEGNYIGLHYKFIR